MIHSQSNQNPLPKISSHSALIWVDQKPFQDELIQRFYQVRGRLEKATCELDRFENNDRRAFETWKSKIFAVELSESAELKERVEELRSRLHRISFFVDHYRVKPDEAIRLFELERDDPKAFEKSAAELEKKAKIIREAEEARFKEARSFWSEERKRLQDESEFEQIFVLADEFQGEVPLHFMEIESVREYLFDVLDGTALFFDMNRVVELVYGESEHDHHSEPRVDTDETAWRGTHGPEHADDLEPEKLGHQLKLVFRRIARAIHPDRLRPGELTENHRNWWHLACQAYEDRDLALLKSIEAFCRLEMGESIENATLSDLEGLVSTYVDRLEAVEKNVRRFRAHPAWKLSLKLKKGQSIAPGKFRRVRLEVENVSLALEEELLRLEDAWEMMLQ